MIDNNEFERRKSIRRQYRKSKNIDKFSNDEKKDEHKLNKRFKKYKQELLEEERWQEWQDEDD